MFAFSIVKSTNFSLELCFDFNVFCEISRGGIVPFSISAGAGVDLFLIFPYFAGEETPY